MIVEKKQNIPIAAGTVPIPAATTDSYADQAQTAEATTDFVPAWVAFDRKVLRYGARAAPPRAPRTRGARALPAAARRSWPLTEVLTVPASLQQLRGVLQGAGARERGRELPHSQVRCTVLPRG